MHVDKRPFECSFCGKLFKIKSLLVYHQRMHNGVKPFECSFCGKQFSYTSNLSAHKMIHTGEKPFKCSICQRPFRSTSTLKIHQTTHTDDKPFECSLCAKRFRSKPCLKQHQITHTDDRPFECSDCEKRFRHKRNLIGHKQKLHSSTPNRRQSFTCDICEMSFSRSETLDGHIQMHIGTTMTTFDICDKYSKMEECNNNDTMMFSDGKPLDSELNNNHAIWSKYSRVNSEDDFPTTDKLFYNNVECNGESDINNCLSNNSNKVFPVQKLSNGERFKCCICWESFMEKEQRDEHLQIHI